MTMNWTHRISGLPPEHRKLLLCKLAEKKIDILQLPIPGQDRSENQRFPLSVGQERLWLIHQLDPGNFAYNILCAVSLEGNLDGPAMEQGINEIVRRHETLRTIFIFDNHNPAQIILPGLYIPLKIIDFKDLPPGQQERKVEEFILADSRQPFNLAQGPLLRTSLLQLNEKIHIFLLVIHHIISDGTSIPVFIRELVRLYDAFSRDKPSPLPGLPIQYVDYVCWQRQWFGDRTFDIGFMKKQEDYWLEQFSGEILVQPLPTDYSRPVIQNFEGNRLSFVVESNETRALKKMASKESASLYIVLLAVYNMFLSRLSGTDDIVVVSPVTGRRHPSIQDLIGMFVNMLALRNFPHPDKTFGEFLGDVRERTLSAFENQEYRYEDIIEKLNAQPDSGRSPLLDIPYSMILDDVESLSINLPGIRSTAYEWYNQTSKFDLALSVREEGDQLKITFEYCIKLFKKETIERYGQYFIQLIRSVISHMDIKLSEIDIVPRKEKARILNEFNRTRTGYPQHKSIGQLFAEQVEVRPDNTAVVFEHTQLTYRKLKSQVNQWAMLLNRKGVQPDTIVPIMLERSLEIVVGILGIVTAGGAYLPIDPDYSQERIDFMLKDSGARLLVTTGALVEEDEKVGRWEGEIYYIEESLYYSYPLTTFLPSYLQSPANLVYIIYTSGSTGRPKGVLIEQKGVINLVYCHQEVFNESPGVRISQVANSAFDAMTSEIWPCLLSGATLDIVPDDIRMDVEGMKEWLIKNQITLSYQPTIMGELLLKEEWPEHGTALRILRVAGDRLTTYPARSYPFKFYNLYGPTEDTVWTTWTRVDAVPGAANFPPIGKPVANHWVYIMGPGFKLKPIGVVGELCISGIGIARGYLNNPELTREKFDHDLWDNQDNQDNYISLEGTRGLAPLSKKVPYKSYKHLSIPPLPHSPIYKTGDLSRWLPDGNIEFLGRIDHQVKIRGFRVELGEIESRLSNHPGVKEVVVLAFEYHGRDKYLCAYIVSHREYSASEFREYLSKELPDYMIPSYFVQIEKIPLTANGKVDRRALPEPEWKAGEGYIAPRDKIEEKLVEIWCTVLGLDKEKISIDAKFFELGGHSLRATTMAAKIYKELKAKVPLAEIFRTPTIRGLARYIGGLKKYSFVSIGTVEEKEYYSQSSSQERLYLLQQMGLEAAAYNISLTVVLEGGLDKNRLEGMFRELIRRHESLRTSFYMIDEEPVQRIHEKVEFKIEYYDISRVEVDVKVKEERLKPGGRGEETDGRSDAHLSSVIRHLSPGFIRPFDLSCPPLLRVGLIKEQDQKYILMIDMHHIITDGVSMELFIRETMVLYSGEKLPPLRLRYRDYAQWQTSDRQKETIKEQEQYWLRQFADEVPVLDMPFDYPRPAVQSFEGAALSFEVPGELSRSINQIALDIGATLYMVLLALYNILLSKLSGQEDIVVGTAIAGRRHADLEKIIGMFVNTLALRNYPNSEKTAREFLEEVKESTLQAFENQEYQFEDLVEQVSVHRDTSRNPLFDTMFALQNMETQAHEIPRLDTSQLRIRPYESEHRSAKFDLTLTCYEAGEELLCSFEYCTKLYKKDTIERFVIYFKQILSAFLAEGNQKISQIEIITTEEKKQILHGFNNTMNEYPRDKTIYGLFEEQVEWTPDNIAVIGPLGKKYMTYMTYISYRELNEKSNRLAYLLMEKGVKPDIIVGLMVPRSLDMIVGLYAILKAGGAYMPIDPDSPPERIDFMLKDSGAKILVATNILEEKAWKLKSWEGKKNFEILFLDAHSSPSHPTRQWDGLHNSLTSQPSNSPLLPAAGRRPSATPLAYLIYTSGSTGKPRGAMIEHPSVINRLNWMQKVYPIGPGDVILQKTPVVFDVSVWELFWWSFHGAALCLLGGGEEKDPGAIAAALGRYRVTTMHFVPSMLNVFLLYFESLPDVKKELKRLKSLKQVFSSGEALAVDQAARFYRLFKTGTPPKLINLYGPTEATVDVSCFECTPGIKLEKVPIGKPIDNIRLYVLDRDLQLQPIGISGELVIAGVGLARGYLNKPELTGEKFCLRQPGALFEKTAPGPRKNFLLFHSPLTTHHSPIYQTGDLARWLSDGNIEFLGRIDHQVKIRGFRIELGEIEHRLLTHEKIKEAIVIVREDNNDKYLCAYMVAPSNEATPIDPSELRDYLTNHLPDYMVPSYFVQLDHIPLTPNGKVDRKALPALGTGRQNDYAAPRDEVEKKLVEIWSGVLGIEKEKIGINDNFFHLGGHSLKAIILVSKIHKELMVKLPLAEVFKSLTIRGMAEFIKGAVKYRFLSIEKTEEKEFYPLSSAQKRLYILQQMALDSTGYNMPSMMVLQGDFNGEKIEDTFRRLIRRYENFRISFEIERGEPVQRVHKDVEFEIEYYDLATESTEKKPFESKSQELRAKSYIKSFIRPFDLSKAPLIRVGLIKIEPTKHILMIDMHHIITDGVSMDLFVRETMALYSDEKLPLLRLQYRDYSEWQNSARQKKTIEGQEGYWLRQYADEVPVMDLPLDYPRPKVQSFEGAALSIGVSGELTRSINRMALDTEVTLYMVVLAVYNILLSKLSGQEDIVVGTPVAARRHADLERIIGMFVNTLALRNYPDSEKTAREFLEEVKKSTLDAFENQEYQFEDLVERVSIHRDTSRNPLFDTMFVLQNMETPANEIPMADIPQLRIDAYNPEYHSAKFDLALVCFEAEEELLCSFEYCTKIFKKDTIERFVIYFKQVLSAVLENRHQKIFRIEIITTEEKQQILYGFNSTMSEYPRDKTLYCLFEEQVEGTPDNIAVIGPLGKKYRSYMTYMTYISYRELNEKSNQLAYLLMEKGVKPDTIVGIMMERSLEMIIGILGILKAGGAYMPIDPDYPQERIDYMLKDSSAQALVVDNTSCASWLSFAPKALLNLSEGLHLNFPASLPSSLAYVIYTSGSTGKSKGVLVEHGNVVRLVKSTNFIDAAPGDRLLLTGAFVFDITTFEIWYPLLNGIALYLADQEVILNAEELGNFLVENKISILHLIPQLFNALVGQRLDIFKGLKYFLVGGDLVRPHSINRLRNEYPGVKILHCYGPTENTTFSTTLSVDRDYQERLPIGRPIQNSSVYIMSRHGELLPIGVAGELCTAGAGVARGYLNNPEMTREKFVFYRSYRSYMTYIPKRFYKTGDLARWLPQGSIEFLGRIDYQVKIRGFRIEPGEIESRLLTYNGIKETVVVAKTDEKEDKYLCAYIVSNIDITAEEVRGFLSGRLPDYMIPSYFIQVESIPLTPTGKVDRDALPVPAAAKVDDYIAPQGEIEKKLVEIWFEVLALEKDKISIAANFFQLGGHSLRATIMAAKIHKALNIKIPLAEIFKNPTIRGLAEYIKNSIEDRYASIKPIEKKQYYILSPAQKRLYILQQMDLGSTAYNMPEVIPLDKTFNLEKLEEVFNGLIERHESLRTSFHVIADEPVQRVHDEVELEIEYYNLSTDYTDYTDDKKDTKNIEGLTKVFGSPETFFQKGSWSPKAFDLSRAPLMRVGLLTTGEGDRLLLVDMHHIISDGFSHEILERDFMTLYEAKALTPLRIQYQDFSQWKNSEDEKENLQQQWAYWLKEFTGEIPVLNLPTDYKRPVIQDFEGDMEVFDISVHDSRALKSLALSGGATMFMVLLALYNVLLTKLGSQEDVVIGVPLSGRRHADLENIMGMFVNTLPLRNYPYGEKTFREFLREVKGKALEAFENQDYPFEEVVEKLTAKLARDTSRNPIFDVMFDLQSQVVGPGRTIRRKELGAVDQFVNFNKTSKFDLVLHGQESSEELFFFFEYSTRLFKKQTIQRFIGYFKKIVSVIAGNPGIKLQELEIISEEEKNRLLFEFNNQLTRFEYPRDKTLHHLFETQAERTPNHIALIIPGNKSPGPGQVQVGGQYLTYGELNQRANGVAGLLWQKGVDTHTIVGLMVERSLEMIVSILGILKSGGAYLPIDVDYPEERIAYMLNDSGARILLTAESLRSGISCINKTSVSSVSSVSYLSYMSHMSYISYEAKKIPVTGHRPLATSLAYVIYTSGTTGKPKGAMIQHRNVVRLMMNDGFQFDFNERDVWTMFHSYCFDFSVWEMYGALLYGGKLMVISKMTSRETERYLEILKIHGVTVLNQTPAAFYHLMALELNEPQKFLQTRYVIFGGEALNTARLKEWKIKYPGTKLINMYGITETTVHVTFKEVRDPEIEAGISNIGSPIPTLTVYIVDRYMNIQPVAAAGEMLVGGDGVGRGYLNRPELTHEKFWISKNFLLKGTPTIEIDGGKHLRAKSQELRAKFYKSGDLARWLPEGDLEYLGRIDTQVKIRGFRVELGEIERHLTGYPGIKEAVVITKEEEIGNKYLCAYIVSDHGILVPAVREYLLRYLPDYMVPSYFMVIEKIPLTPNGKLDSKSLPAPGIQDGERIVPPADDIEASLILIWSELLALDPGKISVSADFFTLGGHSLKATVFISRVYGQLGVRVPLVEIFRTPTVRQLARYIKDAGGKTTPITDKNLVLLKKSTDGAGNLFFIHDGTGDVEGYVEFCKGLNIEVHCWGIQAAPLENYTPVNLSIENIAANYIKILRKVQPQGPYSIAGWSLGGTIAFEIALQLEKIGQEVSFLGMIDSPGPQKNEKEEGSPFTLESEIDWAWEYLLDEEIKEKIKKAADINQIWPIILKHLEENHIRVEIIKQLIPHHLAQVIPNYEQLDIKELIYYLNINRTLSRGRALYIPSKKIDTVLYYFKASRSPRIFQESWNDYCLTPIKFYEVSGNHFSIIKKPTAARWAELFDTALNFDNTSRSKRRKNA